MLIFVSEKIGHYFWRRVYMVLTHWGRVTYICVGKLTIIGSDNGLLPERRQANIWTNAGILLIGTLGTNFSEISIGIQTFSFKKMHLKMAAICLGLNVLSQNPVMIILVQRMFCMLWLLTDSTKPLPEAVCYDCWLTVPSHSLKLYAMIVDWQYQAITWICMLWLLTDSTKPLPEAIIKGKLWHSQEVSQVVLVDLIQGMCSGISCLKLVPHLPRTNEFRFVGHICYHCMEI